MVLVVVVETEVVGRGIHKRCLRIAAVEEELVYHAVLHDKASPEEVLPGAGVHGLALGKRIRLRAERHRDIRRRNVVLHAELLPRGAVPVLGHVAVGEVYLLRVAVGVVPPSCFRRSHYISFSSWDGNECFDPSSIILLVTIIYRDK